MIIKKIEELDKVFLNQKFRINLHLSDEFSLELIDALIINSNNHNSSLFIYFNKNNRLIGLDFSKKYEISNYAYLDQLNDAKKIDYSLKFL